MTFNFKVHIEGVSQGAAGAVNFEVIVVKQILPGHLSFFQLLLGSAEGVMEISNRSENPKASRFTGSLERKE